MNNVSYKKKFNTLIFFLLFFFWDRFFESFIGFQGFGIIRPIVIIALWLNVIMNWQYLKSSVHNFNQLLKWFYFIMLLALLLMIFSLGKGVPFLGIIYTYFQHLGFLPIVLLILSFAKSPVYVVKILRVLMLSTLFLTFGVILDAYVGMQNIFYVEGVDSMTRIGVYGIKRGDFTIGSTNVFITLSLGVIAIYLLVFKFRYSALKGISALIFIAMGMYASSSRASTILGFFLIMVIFLRFFKNRNSFFSSFFLTLCAGGIFVIFIQIGVINLNTERLDRFENFTSEDAEGNFGRYQAWSKGISMIGDINNAFGNGVGTTNPHTEILFGSPHIEGGGFESSFFSRYYEGGIIGLFIFMFPFFATIFMFKSQMFNILNLWMILMYFNFLIAPTAQGYPSNLIIYICLALCLLFKNFKYQLSGNNSITIKNG